MNRRLTNAIRLFWTSYGYPPPRPCNLDQIISLALPVTPVGIANLSVSKANQWLNSRRITYALPASDRRLRGALLAFAGQGVIFFDETDNEDERRYTLAREVAHFLDYWSLRRELLQRYGPTVVEIFDGNRPAATNEQLRAVLSGVPVGVWTDLMNRSASGSWSAPVDAAEKAADEIALTLLAPAQEVIKKARLRAADSYSVRKSRVCDLLQQHFGVPAQLAEGYGAVVLSRAGLAFSWVESISRSTP